MDLKPSEPDFGRAFPTAGTFSSIVGLNDSAIIEIAPGLKFKDPGALSVDDIYAQIMLSVAPIKESF